MMESRLQFDFATQQAILRKIAAIDAFQSRWLVEQTDEKVFLKQMKTEAMLESTGSSTRIEGSTLTNLEVESVLKNMKITQLKTREEQEVVGYYEVLALIMDSFENIPLSENYIKQLHGHLLRHSDKDQRHRGAYKNLSNQVVAASEGGTKRIVFNTTLPHLTPIAMQELTDWTNEAAEADVLHPLLIIAIFIYEFLSIHPFQDGNGRLSRLLTTLLLLKYRYDFVQYCSFENLIEERKNHYYHALMSGQQKRGQADETIEKWVLFFLECLNTLTQQLTEKRAKYKEMKGYLNERQKRLIAAVAESGSIQIADLVKILPDFSRATIKNDLALLVKRQVLVQVGSGRGVRYFVAKSAE